MPLPRFAGAVALALTLLAASCGDADDEASPAASSTTVASSTSTTTSPSTSTTTSTTSSTTTTTTAPPISAADLCGIIPGPGEPVVVESPELTEISGLAVSRQHPGLLWAHNDSGDSARLHLIDADTGADLGSWMLQGAGAFDWEDMAISTDSEGGHQLWAADFGDNFRIRSDIRVYRTVEPTDVGTPGPLDAETFIFTYPDGATDAESLFIDPDTGDLIIISKSWDDSPTSIYRGPAMTPPDTPTELEKIGEVDLTGFHPLATAADITADGRVIALRTISEVLLWDRPPDSDIGGAMSGPPCVAPTAAEPQGEAIAFLPDGSGYVTISEGANPPIHRFVIDSAG